MLLAPPVDFPVPPPLLEVVVLAAELRVIDVDIVVGVVLVVGAGLVKAVVVVVPLAEPGRHCE